MHGQVVVQLRVEGCHELLVLPSGDDVAVHLREHLGLRAGCGNVRRADERHRNAPDAAHLVRGGKAAELAAVGVAAHGDVHRPEADRAALDRLREQNQPRARAKHRQAAFDLLPQRLKQTEIVQKLSHRGALPAGENQPVERPVEIAALPDLKMRRAQPVEHSGVLDEGALQRQNRNGHLTCPVPPSAGRSHPR